MPRGWAAVITPCVFLVVGTQPYVVLTIAFLTLIGGWSVQNAFTDNGDTRAWCPCGGDPEFGHILCVDCLRDQAAAQGRPTARDPREAS